MSSIGKILLASIDPNFTTVLKEVFVHEGCEVLLATTGREILQTLGESEMEVDVALFDLSLPDDDGVDLLKQIRGLNIRTEVIILSNQGSIDRAVEAMRYGAYDFLEKPLTIHKATQVVRNALEKRQLQSISFKLAWENRDLSQRLETITVEISQTQSLVQFAREVNKHLKLESILEIIYHQLPSLVKAESFSLFFYDTAKCEFKLLVNNRPNLDPHQKMTIPEEKSPLMRQAIETKEVLFLEDIHLSGYAPPVSPGTSQRYKRPHAVIVPMKVEARPIGILNLNDFSPEVSIRDNLHIAVLIAEHLASAIFNGLLYQELEHAVNLDGLTGLYNHSYFQKQLSTDFQRAKRYRRPFSLIFLDIDHFKEFNDTYGHMAGDEILRKISAILKESIREGIDVAARYGGEEFVIVAPETDDKGARLFAERIRDGVLQEFFRLETHRGSQEVHLTVSLGVTSYLPEIHQEVNEKDLISYADAALYQSKRKGRNRTTYLKLGAPWLTSKK